MTWRKYLVLLVLLALVLTVCACLPALATDATAPEDALVETILTEPDAAQESQPAPTSEQGPALEQQPAEEPKPTEEPEHTIEPEPTTEQEPTAEPSSEDDPTDNAGLIRLVSSKGEGISGATVKYYSSGWVTAGKTDTSGELQLDLADIKNPQSTRIQIVYRNMSIEDTRDLTSGSNTFRTVPVTVKLLNHEETPLDGGSVTFYSGGWYQYGTANTEQELLPGTYRLKVTYRHMSVEKTAVIGNDGGTVLFQTVPITIALLDHAGNPLEGGSVTYYSGGWYTLGAANAAYDLLPADEEFSFKMTHRNLSQNKIMNPAKDRTLDFQTGLVELRLAGGTIQYYAGGYRTHKNATEYLPVEMDFRFSGQKMPEVKQSITPVAGSSVVYNVAYVRVMSSTGVGLADVKLQYFDTDWRSAGNTDANGIKLLLLDANRTSYTFSATHLSGEKQIKQDIGTNGFVLFRTSAVRVNLLSSKGEELRGEVSYYSNGWHTLGDSNNVFELFPKEYTFKMKYLDADPSIKQNVAENPTVEFRTTAVTVKLIDSKGADLAGGSVRLYSRNWFNFGAANTTLELLPFTYTFEMKYLDAKQQKSLIVSGESSDLTFQTGLVDLRLAGGKITFYTTNWFKYEGPTELLPVETTFKFEGGGFAAMQLKKVWANEGERYRSNVAMVRVMNSTKAGIADVPISVYDGAWQNGIGTTGANGQWLFFGSERAQYTFLANVAGSAQQITRDITTDGFVTFRTSAVTVKLLDSKGGTLVGTAEYYADGKWIPFGSGETGAAVEMLPGKYSFAVYYNGMRQPHSKWDVEANPDVLFQTIPVTVQLLDSTKMALAGGTAEYYAGKWRAFGDTGETGTAEMLPGKYSFAIYYNGARQQHNNWDVEADRNVIFQTIPVTVHLLDSNENVLAGGIAEYYAGKWRTFGDAGETGTAEMLPGKYSFAMYYDGARQQFEQNVSEDPIVIFRTVNVKVQHLSQSKKAISGGTVKYYTNVWKDYGAANGPGKEMLPGTYTFELRYDGKTESKTQDVASNSTIVFTSSVPEKTVQMPPLLQLVVKVVKAILCLL